MFKYNNYIIKTNLIKYYFLKNIIYFIRKIILILLTGIKDIQLKT